MVMDQISRLPDPILQHILFFLPAKDAAQTSVLSKTWLNVWNSLHVFTFDFDENRYIQEHMSTEAEGSKQDVERDAFLSVIDSSLIHLRTQKAIIEKFRLALTLPDLKSASCIDDWIGLATNNCIKELDVHIMCQDDKDRYHPQIKDDQDWYTLPGNAFAAKSMVALRVRGCTLEWPIVVDHIKLTNLRGLSLTDVLLDKRIILEIVSACPMVEDLSLIRCRGVKDLSICDLPKLLNLTLHQVGDITHRLESIWIQAVNLQSLYYRGCNSELKFDVPAFKLLKELIITYEQITDQMVENLASELPLLEKLELNFCFKLTRLRFSSSVLRQLAFRSGKSLMEVVIDTPKLLRFEYGASELPTIFSITTSSLQESYLKLMPHNHLNASWFQNLREYLSRFEQLNRLTLSITSTTNTFNVEELNGSSFCSLSIVKHLKLQDVDQSLNYEDLLNGLLWTCHPEILSVDNRWEENDNFIQFLKEKVMERELDPVCCDSRRIKCWRHYLKDVEIESSTTSQCVDPSSPYRVPSICFKLRW